MGRFDGPHFETPDEDVVSIWLARCSFDAIPETYVDDPAPDPDGDDDDDASWNDFSTDFGFGYYDHDFVESNQFSADTLMG